MAATGSAPAPVITAARFIIQIQNLAQIAFSELSGINSEVEPVEYISVDSGGNIVHTKQFGKTKPPKVSLKRGMDKEGTHNLWAWHQAVLDGDPGALRTCELTLKTSSGEISLSYVLEDAWPAKIDVAGAKAGSSDVITQTVEMVCSQIYMP